MEQENKHYVKKTFSFPNNWSEKQYFIHACFVDDLQVFFSEWVEQGRKSGRIQFFDTKDDGTFEHKYWKPSNKCCVTGEILTKDNIDVRVGYFTPNIWKPVRKDLMQEAKKQEAYECQKIDCSCSDCKFSDRAERFCNKFSRKIKIISGVCHPQNLECFEHRLEPDRGIIIKNI